MSVDYHAIGQRIKRKRKLAGQTQDKLAEALCVSVGYISQLERGVTKISLDTLSKIAFFLECDLCELISGVAYSQNNYLEQELEQLYLGMNCRQKQLLLDIARTLARY